MRTSNSAKNVAANLSLTVLSVILGFVTRKVFVDEVGVEYLGLNGLLSNILGMMTLIEGGFAGSVVYHLYKPVADDDRPTIIALLYFYRKVYRYIGLVVAGFGVALYPFLEYFIADISQLNYVGIVYAIFLFNTLIQYLTAYKWSIINVSQKNYKMAGINMLYQLGLSVSKIAILFFTQNYILYLIVEAIFGVGLNIAAVKKANKLFPYIVNAIPVALSKELKKKILTNMKYITMHSLGAYFMFSTDNIVMSAYIGVGIVGLYSNYTLLISTLNSFASQALNSLSESVGNLIASESDNYAYEVFKTVFFINFLTVSVPAVIIATSIQPFIGFWLGNEYQLSAAILANIVLNTYISGMRSSSLTFKTRAGIFRQDRYTPIIQGLINLGLSLAFVRIWGLAGVLAATTISILSIGFWQTPRILYKYGFHRSVWSYFRKYSFYTLVFLFNSGLCLFVTHWLDVKDEFLKVLCNGSATFFITAIVYYIVFSRTKEFKSLIRHLSMLNLPFLQSKIRKPD